MSLSFAASKQTNNQFTLKQRTAWKCIKTDLQQNLQHSTSALVGPGSALDNNCGRHERAVAKDGNAARDAKLVVITSRCTSLVLSKMIKTLNRKLQSDQNHFEKTLSILNGVGTEIKEHLTTGFTY